MEGRVLSRADQQAYLRFQDVAVLEHKNATMKSKQQERDLLYNRLASQFEKYDIEQLRLNMHADIMKTMKQVEITTENDEEQLRSILDFVQ